MAQPAIPEERRIRELDERCDHVGNFFVELTHWLTGGHRDPHTTQITDVRSELIHDLADCSRLADLLHWGMNAALEVKGSNNLSGSNLGLRGEQVLGQLHQMENEWRVKHHLYFVYSWRSGHWVNGKARPFLSEHKDIRHDALRLRLALAERTNALFVIDTRLLKAAYQMYGFTIASRRDHSHHKRYLRLNRTLLRNFCEDARQGLEEMDCEQLIPSFLPPRAKRIRTFRVATEIPITYANTTATAPVLLTVYPIAPVSIRRRLKKVLNGTVLPPS